MKLYKEILLCVVTCILITKHCAAVRYEVFAACNSWYEAVVLCEEKGGSLAIIPDEETHNHIVSLIHGGGHHDVNFWINSHDTTSEGQFITTNGDPIPYSNWADGEPNNYNAAMYTCGGYQDCTKLWSQRENFQWDDEICCQMNGYVCEFADSDTTTRDKPSRHSATTVPMPAASTQPEKEKTQRTTQQTGEASGVTTRIQQLCTQMLTTSPTTADISSPTSNKINPMAEKHSGTANVETTNESSQHFIVILLILSIINFITLIGISVFLYFNVWKKAQRCWVDEPRYRDLVNQPSNSEMYLTK